MPRRKQQSKNRRRPQLLTPAPSGQGTPGPSTQGAPDRIGDDTPSPSTQGAPNRFGDGTPGPSSREERYSARGSHVTFSDDKPNKKPKIPFEAQPGRADNGEIDDEVMLSGNHPELESEQSEPTSELDDEQLEETIEHDSVQPLSDHVKKVIWAETNRHNDLVRGFFDNEETSSVQTVERFFTKLNEKIRTTNHRNGMPLFGGQIGYQPVIEAVNSWRKRLGKSNQTGSGSKLITDFDNTYQLINAHNEKFYLPEGWNIETNALESMLSANDMEILIERVARHTYRRAPPAARQPSIVHDLTEENLTGFQRLEARAMSEQRAISSGEVLYWWKRGTGYQTFVKYGDVDPVYRIRSGSYEPFNRREVEQVLSSESRGTQKRTFRGTDGIKAQDWVWTRDQVADILAVGWKVPDDDDGDVDPLSLIVPEPGAIYPETRVIILWNDGRSTLETRTFIRRIAAGPNRNGDNILYQKALEFEQAHGDSRTFLPSEDESDEESDTTSRESEDSEGNPPGRITKRHPQPRETRGHSANSKRAESETSRYRKSSHKTRNIRRNIEKLTRQLAQLENGSRKPRQGARHS